MSQDYGLTENERKFLEARAADGDLRDELAKREVGDSYVNRPDKLEKGVTKKVEALPYRIESLLEDVDLLFGAGYLTEQKREELDISDEGWHEALDFHPFEVDRFVSDEPSFSPDDGTVPARLGRDLSRLAAQTLYYPGEIPKKDIEVELAIGFVSGIADRHALKDAAPILVEFSEVIEEEASSYQDTNELFASGSFLEGKGWDVLVELNTAINEHLETTLDEHGIEPSNRIVRSFDAELSGRRVKQQILGDIPDNALASDLHDIEWNLDEYYPEREILATVEDRRLVERDRLENLLQDDLERFEELEKNGVAAMEILPHIPPAGAHVGDIADSVSEEYPQISKARAIPAVAAILEYLSGVGNRSLGRRDGPPVVDVSTENCDHFGQWGIEFTDYGRVVHEATKKSSTVVHLHPLHFVADEYVEAAFDELELETSY